jgi:hypothetical protein
MFISPVVGCFWAKKKPGHLAVPGFVIEASDLLN